MKKSKASPLTITSGLDQANRLPYLADSLKRIVSETNQAIDSGETSRVFGMLGRLYEFGKISAIGQAAVLWLMRQHWPKIVGTRFISAEELEADYYNRIFSETGYMPETIRRYLLAWNFLDMLRQQGVSDKVWEEFAQRGIGELIALGQNVNEKGPFGKSALDALSSQPDLNSLRKTIRQLRGEENHQKPIEETILRSDGSLEVWCGDEVEVLGYIRLELGPLGERAKARIIRKANIQERQ